MTKPADSEFEIALFGPGYGESVLVHIGGNWLVLDSCIYRGQQEPAPLSYLKNLGVDLEREVAWVIATHWHDDHIRGLSQILEACPSAKFGCPSALNNKEFWTLLAHYRLPTQLQWTGVDEFNRVLQELERRGCAGRPQRPAWIHESRELMARRVSIGGVDVDARVLAASPSDGAVERSMLALNRCVPSAPAAGASVRPIRRITSVEPNHAAVVVHVSVGKYGFIFGSDLEVTAEGTEGWHRVTDVLRDKTKSHTVKIPHHGSITAHHEPMWDELLVPRPMALLTPFRRGRVALPTSNDVARIRDRTPHAYISCRPRNLQLKHPDNVVQKMLKGVLTSPLTAQAASGGMIRVRGDLRVSPSEWDVLLLDGALALSEIDSQQDIAVA